MIGAPHRLGPLGMAPLGRPAGARSSPVVRFLPFLLLLAFASGCEPRVEWEGGPGVGDPAPEYTIQDLGGGPAGLDDYVGDPVLLNFWATWCAPCRTETPFLQSIHEGYGPRGLQVVGVSLDSPGSVEDIREFMDEMGVTYDILYDPRQVGMDRFSLIGLPVTYVLDSEGEIRFVRVGPVSENDREFMDILNDVTS